MKNFVEPGDVLTLTAPMGGVVSGMGYQIGQLFVVAAIAADADAEFEGQLTGVFDLPKADSQAWTPGALVYWDAGDGEATTTAAGNMLIGAAARDEASDATTGRVRLNGVARADEAP